MNRVREPTERVCVIGAGSSGLAAARNLAACGFAVDVLDREDDLGGNWNYGKPSARVYASTHTISSKPGTEYHDFPMPAEYPDYPHHTQILAYLRAYASHFGVQDRIEFSTPVGWVEPLEDGRRWRVQLGSGEERQYDAVVIANGHNWSPKLPSYPGRFEGEVIHSAAYRMPDAFTGKRVLVVGGGNSGCDIAVEAGQHATAAFHSTRRGYHYIPKYIAGRPADQWADVMLAHRIPLRLRRLITTLAVRRELGSPCSLGLPAPDHRLYETHPIINSGLPLAVQRGEVTPKRDVERLERGHVRFVDGSVEEIDLLVYATGYSLVFPFIDTALLNWKDGCPRLYLNVFHPRYDNLFVAGMIQPDSGQFGLVHWQTRVIALFLQALRTGAPTARWLQTVKAQWTPRRTKVRYKPSTRHLLEVEHWSYRQALMKWTERLSRYR